MSTFKLHSIYAAILSLTFASYSTFASHWYTSLNVGLGMAKVGKTETLNLFATSLPPITNTYDADRKYRFGGLLGVGAGYRFDEERSVTWSLGASASYLTYGSIDGTVHPYVNISPNFDTL